MRKASQSPFLHADKVAPIHPSAWTKVFSEVGLEGVLGKGSVYLDYNHLTCVKTMYRPTLIDTINASANG